MMTAAASATPRTRSLLEHFSQIRDTRQPCKVMYPLSLGRDLRNWRRLLPKPHKR